MAVEKDFVIFKGDTFSRTLRFKNSQGGILDISNWIFYFTIKYSYELDSPDDDSKAIIKKIYNVGNGASGTQVISLTKEETAAIEVHNYKYDVKIKKPGEVVTTLLSGNFLVVNSVTKDTT